MRFQVEKLEFNSTTLGLRFRYRVGENLKDQWISVTKELNKIAHWYLPQKYTFLHPSGTISYAVIRPPSPNAPCKSSPSNILPILIALHGAGVDADNTQSKEQYDALPDLCSWLVLPSGVTSWSGDDWRKCTGVNLAILSRFTDQKISKMCGGSRMLKLELMQFRNGFKWLDGKGKVWTWRNGLSVDTRTAVYIAYYMIPLAYSNLKGRTGCLVCTYT